MHFSFFDDLMGSALEASPEISVRKRKGTFRKQITHQMIF